MNIDTLLNSMKRNYDSIAIVTEGITYTFGEIYQEYEKIGKILDERKIADGKVVSLIAEFSPISIAYFLSLIERNVILVPISKAVKNMDEPIRISESQFVIDLRNEKKTQIWETKASVKHEMLKVLKEREVPGLILFSSGTTGEPKAALHDLSLLMEKFRNPGKKLSVITFLLFDHIGGFNTMMYSLTNGSLIVTLKDRSPEEVCKLIETYHVELLPTSPTFLNMLLLSHVYEKYDLSSLQMITYGTEPMPESALKSLHRLLPNVKLKQTYGLSEIGILSTKSESSDSLYMKIGGKGFETKVINGILHIKAKSAMMGYLNAPSPFDEDGWLNTKDQVEVKGEYMKILGRTTDLINIGGQKVYPNEIESALLSVDGVKDVYVYGKDSPITGKMVVAEIWVDPENQNRDFVKELRRYSKEHLESFKRPVSYRLTDKPFYSERYKKKR